MSMVFEDRRNYAMRDLDCPPRRARVPIHDVKGVAWRPAVANLIDCIGCFYLRSRDILDFGLLFQDWLQANGDSVLKTASWAAGSDSPFPPTIVEDQFFPSGESFVIIGPGTIGDVYFLDCTVTIDVVQQRGGEVIPIVERTLVRRIMVSVIAG
jgi:hypothetical protein